MANLETINVTLQDMPEKQLPEVIDFIGYLKSKGGVNFSGGVWRRFTPQMTRKSDYPLK